MPHRIIKSILITLLLVGSVCSARDGALTEYEVKAAFLYNFTSFVEWPDAAFSNPVSPLVIGVLGDDPFGSTLDDMVRGKEVNGHSIRIQRLTRGSRVDGCQLVFIANSERGNVAEVLAGLADRPILTVADLDSRDCAGTMIVMALGDNGRLKLLINLNAAEQAGLKVSSRLLRLAEIIEDK
jgi:hypothetical protein